MEGNLTAHSPYNTPHTDYMPSPKFLMLFILVFCLSANDTIAAQPVPRSHEPVNAVDEQGRRQGYWRILGHMAAEPGYKKNQVVEEGHYEDNKREGVWVKYYPTGSILSEITYQHNHPKGPYKVFYPNGKVEEEGNWQANKNVSTFKRYHENGKLAQEFTFNEVGKRSGLQKYYYDNGNLQMSVEIDEGVAHGMLRTYHRDGSLREEKRLIEGRVDHESVKVYPPKSGQQGQVRMPDIPVHETQPENEDKPNLGEFKHNGFNTLYNKNLQITQVGEFKEGRLWNGRWHRYDENGILKKIEVFSNGRFVGYQPLEEAQ